MLKDRGELRRWLFACEASRHGPQNVTYRQRALELVTTMRDPRRICGIEDPAELDQPPLYTGEAEEGDGGPAPAAAAGSEELLSLFKLRYWMTAVKRSRAGSDAAGTRRRRRGSRGSRDEISKSKSSDGGPGAKSTDSSNTMKMERAPPAHELPVSIREIQEGALDELFKDADERPFADISTAPDADANSKKFLGRKGTR